MPRQERRSKGSRVPDFPRRINEQVYGQGAVTADTDLRLARNFGVSKGPSLGLQADRELMRRRRAIAEELAEIVPRPA